MEEKQGGKGWFRISAEVRVALVEEYKTGSSINVLSKKYNITWAAAKNIIKEAGISIRQNISGEIIKSTTKIFPETRLNIIEDYKSGLSSVELAPKYGVTQTIISKIVREARVNRTNSESKRVYSVDEAVFDKVTEESAYWAGFLTADGSVLVSEGRSPAISLTLQERDRAHVEKFRAFLKAEHPLLTVKASGNKKHLDNTYARLQVRSQKLTDSLAKFGVTPKKVYRTSCPKFLRYNRNFWRGMIDGDGCVYLSRPTTKGSDLRLILVGSEGLMEQFSEFCRFCDPNIKAAVRECKTIFQVGLRGRPAAVTLRELYTNAATYLDRKMELFKEVVSNPIFQSDKMDEMSELYSAKDHEEVLDVF